MKLIRKAGVTSQSVYVLIQDSASTTGAGKTGIAWNAAGMVASYVRTRGSRVAITLATLGAVNSAYSSGGWIEVDATNLPGVYRLDIPDAALASGADSCVVCVRGAANAVDCVLEIDLVAYDPADAVRLGITALPNANAGANGGLPLGDASARVDVGRWLGATPNALVSGRVDSALIVRGGTAQAGAAGSMTLDAGATATDNLYRGLKLLIASGTGAGQERLVTGYTGSTKVATVAPNWITAPDNTSVFLLQGHCAADVQSVNLTAQTARDLGAQLDAAVSTRAAGSIFTGITSLANWLRLALRLGYTDATALGEINTGGTGAFAPATESLEYIANNLGGGGGVADWTTDERNQIRNRLGIDGTAVAPTSGTPTLATAAAVGSPAQATALTTLANRFTGITSLANWLRLALRLGYTDATALSEINTGGTGAFAPATESLEAIAAAGGGGGGGGDPLTNLVPGTYAAGTAGAALGRIGTGTINVVAPLSAGGDLTLIAGDDYRQVDGRALSFSNPDGTWPNLTGATITLVAIRNGATLIEVAGTVVTPTGSQLVRVEPTSTDLAPPATAAGSWEYTYGVLAELANGNKVTLQTGQLTLQRAH